MKARKELLCGTRFFAIMVAIAMIAVEVMTSSNLVITDNREESSS